MPNQIALVTGVSRTQGIGKAICAQLAKQGFDIFFTYWSRYDEEMPYHINENGPEIIQDEIKKLGVKCEKIELDLAADNSIHLLLDTVKAKIGDPQVLVNNATYSTMTNIENFRAEELDRHYKINIRATTLLIVEFIRRFAYSKNGRIINLSSGQSLGQMPNELAYAMTKAAIESLSHTLSSQIAAKGITINAVNPGPNDTGWIDDKLKNELIQRFPMGRTGQPTDAAKLIGFLASEDAGWITGQVIHSEGGFLRG